MKASSNTPTLSRRSFIKASSSVVALGAASSIFNIHIPKASAAMAGMDIFAAPNAQAQQARDAALAIIQPTQKQLEHGLELHKASLVFESYGFSPRCAPDGDAIVKAAKEGASPQELRDLRSELPAITNVTNKRERDEYLAAFRASGVTCIFQNAGEEGNDSLRMLQRLARFTHTTAHLRDHVFKAIMPDDIKRAKKENKHCLYMTTNGVPLRLRFENVRDELGYLRVFYQLGVRMMHLTYNRRNMIGDGVGEAQDNGLSDFGRHVIKEMNKLGIIIDVAHSGWRTSLEAAKASEYPMVASHTTAGALHPHIRSKPDDVVKAICDTNGLVGVCCIAGFLGGDGHIGTFLDHIDYLVKKFGDNYVAIGTDVAYISSYAAEENKKIPKDTIPRAPTRWEALWPEGALTGRRHDSLAWINWPLFTVGMVARGYSDETIQKIIGGNILRVSQDVWKSSIFTPSTEG